MEQTIINFYEQVEDRFLKFAVIVAKIDDKLIFCKHKERDTYEIPGGHREKGENILDTAKRELYEETGAVDFSIDPVCVYSVTTPWNFGGRETFGMLYYANVYKLEKELQNEIEKIIFVNEMSGKWTYPEIQPKLLEEAKKRGFL